jgi:ribonuclease HI
MRLIIHCDGGSKAGRAYGSYEIRDDFSARLYGKKYRMPLGNSLTSNQAEYIILLLALRQAATYEPTSVRVFTDSLLVVNQVLGLWKCKKETLKVLRDEARALMEKLNTEVNWNSREVSVEKFGH